MLDAMKIWGIAFMLLGGGAILAAVLNWHWWFRISSAGGHLVHDAFGRTFARLLNAVAGAALLLVGIADVTGQWPVSAFANAWLFEDKTYLRQALDAESGGAHKQAEPTASGLESYAPDSPSGEH